MLYKTFGSTGLQVSALGFGGMRFENMDDPEACAALVQSAYDAGINYFDTSIGYGRSEECMGLAFRAMRATRATRPFYVATKTFSGTEDEVRRDCETSLKRLQLDAIDFYHVWCILSPEAWRERRAKGVLRAFEKLREEGLVKHVCVSSHMRGREIAEMLRDYPFVSVLLGYSAMNFAFREEALEEASRLGRAVVAMNPLGGGIIPRHPERFGFVRTRPDESVTEGALRLLFNDPRVTVTLVGLANQAQLREALAAVNGFCAIPPERVAAMRQELSQTFNELCTGCGYCEPCPQGVSIPKMMDSYNQYALSGRVAAISERMAWHWGLLEKGHNLDQCTACRQCEAACTQKLPIVERLQTAKEEVAGAVAARAQR
jgi:predicted aldo/keto reductase-like oxidoreductase